MSRLAREALEAHPEGMDTRAIALHVINAKGLDASDRRGTLATISYGVFLKPEPDSGELDEGEVV